MLGIQCAVMLLVVSSDGLEPAAATLLLHALV